MVLNTQRYRLGFKTREFIRFKIYQTLFQASHFLNPLQITVAYTIFVVKFSIDFDQWKKKSTPPTGIVFFAEVEGVSDWGAVMAVRC